ncbi:hypothetical protein [Nocardia sp. NPDC051570]|uniref:hypothetical protein n=1 Tax=Nocardia sp. NPDC051570 TaxID=3364324 RepID=UPI0037A0DDBD
MSEVAEVRVLFVYTPEFEPDPVTAVFVDELWTHDASDGRLASYAHNGQHASADREWVATQRPATVAEYSEVARELFRIGYRVEVVGSFEDREQVFSLWGLPVLLPDF